jgi:hypothetical protein
VWLVRVGMGARVDGVLGFVMVGLIVGRCVAEVVGFVEGVVGFVVVGFVVFVEGVVGFLVGEVVVVVAKTYENNAN